MTKYEVHIGPEQAHAVLIEGHSVRSVGSLFVRTPDPDEAARICQSVESGMRRSSDLHAWVKVVDA